jgi:hypothetical protein
MRRPAGVVFLDIRSPMAKIGGGPIRPPPTVRCEGGPRVAQPGKEKPMTAWQKAVCLGVVLGLVPARAGSAAEFNMSATLDGVRLGDSLVGPKVTPDDLKGKVVLMEFWGIH